MIERSVRGHYNHAQEPSPVSRADHCIFLCRCNLWINLSQLLANWDPGNHEIPAEIRLHQHPDCVATEQKPASAATMSQFLPFPRKRRWFPLPRPRRLLPPDHQ